jgi:hypothetical protein
MERLPVKQHDHDQRRLNPDLHCHPTLRIVRVRKESRDSTCFPNGSKFRCILSTPTEMQSMSENDVESFASTGVNKPETMSPSL